MHQCGKYHDCSLVLLAALVLGDLVTNNRNVSFPFYSPPLGPRDRGKGGDSHVILQLLEVILLLLDLLAEREELLLLGLADEHFLLGALASLEGVTM